MLRSSAFVQFSAATGLALSLSVSAQTPQSYSYAYKTSADAQAVLGKVCGADNMKTRSGQVRCVRETAYQAHHYAEVFYQTLYADAGIVPDAKNFNAMREIWSKKTRKDPKTDVDDLSVIRNYALNCHNETMTAIYDPAAIFKVSNTYTTAFNLPEYCVKTALRFSQDYNLPVDKSEGNRLMQHFAAIQAYYTQNPKIPDALPDEPSVAPGFPQPAPAEPAPRRNRWDSYAVFPQKSFDS